MKTHLLLLLLTPALALADPVKRFDDARWAAYFGSQYAFYVAVRAPRELPGPFLGPALRANEEQVMKHLKPDEALARAIREKVIARPLDLVERGFAIGVTSENGATKLLVVAERTPAADALIAWARRTSAAKEITVAGHPALVAGIATKLFVAVHGDAVLLADRSEDLATAFATQASGMLNLPGSRLYARLRPKVRADAAALAVLSSGPELAALLRQEAIPPQAAQLVEVAMNTVDGYAAAISGDSRHQVLDVYLGLNTDSEGYEKLHLADRAKFYGSQTLKLARVAPGDAGGFVSALQPSLGKTDRPVNQREWDVFKGQLQVHTGLSFDAEIVPWLGPEIALVLRAAGEQPELAVLFSTTDVKASQASLEKVIRHITISQNRKFAAVTYGAVKAQVADPVPGSPLTPALAVTDGTVVLSSSAGLLETLGKYPLKAAQAEPHERVQAAVGRGAFMVGWATAGLAQRIARINGGPNAPGFPDWLEAAGVGLAMPEPDLVHGVITFQSK